ncbi:acetylcholine receptor non-alpha chain-like [Mercenaria mercenaria]|uniref:acetylcholine receptor non-alpha chain-like n=1 Tax=Mercenaria mercenaria TaxID=6596 RepID=UPI00234F381F|nr:acetylcholine receptor non-alpha chain-like [Mercenaria mercenaria]
MYVSDSYIIAMLRRDDKYELVGINPAKGIVFGLQALSSLQKKPDLTVFSESCEWDLIGSDVKLIKETYGTDVWDHVYFILELQRKPLYHVMNVIIPVLCISILNIVSFLLPSESGERVTFSISIFLTLAVFLTTVNSSMPESSDEVPSFSVYLGLQLVGSAFNIIFTIISLKFFHREKSCAVPGLLKILVKACCVQTRNDPPNENAMTFFNDLTNERVKDCNDCQPVTWKMAARATDRLCLISAICWHVILTAGLIISVKY